MGRGPILRNEFIATAWDLGNRVLPCIGVVVGDWKKCVSDEYHEFIANDLKPNVRAIWNKYDAIHADFYKCLGL